MTIEIHQPELERRVREEIQSGHFRDVDDLLTKALDALHEKQEQTASPHPETELPVDEFIAAAARRLGTFGKRHGLSLGDLTVKELLHESRP
jgi:Arc/MetJ-type ribon-helix-helix transcriptional regulator